MPVVWGPGSLLLVHNPTEIEAIVGVEVGEIVESK